MAPCNREKADTRLLVNCIMLLHMDSWVCTVDTDEVVIVIGNFTTYNDCVKI